MFLFGFYTKKHKNITICYIDNDTYDACSRKSMAYGLDFTEFKAVSVLNA